MAVDVGTAVAYLDLNMNSFNQGLQQAQSALQTLSSDAASIGDKLSSVGGMLSNTGSNLTKNLTIPIVNFGQSALGSFTDFEKAITGIRKTLDDEDVANAFGMDVNDPVQLAEAYKMLGERIQEMASETGVSAIELARIGEVSGQLGVNVGTAGENLLNFVETMAKLGVTTDLTSDEAALALARFINVADISQDQVDKLGAAIVDLGNNFATQEPDIVYMSQRLASAGTVAGLTAQEILALSTAISSAGIKTEAGASSMSTTLSNIETIVQGVAENSEQKLQTLAEVSGISAEEFANTWKNEPIKALELFLTGLGRVDTEGESMVLFLNDLGMTSIRQSNLLRALALSSENLSDALDTANKAFGENTALETEWNKYASTTDQQLNMLYEDWQRIKVELGEMLLPILKDLIGVAKDLINWWRGLSDEFKQSVVRIAEIVAAIGPVVLASGTLLTSVGKLVNIFQVISGLGIGSKIANTSGIVQKMSDVIRNVTTNTYNLSNIFQTTGTKAVGGAKKAKTAVESVSKAVKETKKNTENLSNVIQVADGGIVNLNNDAKITSDVLNQIGDKSQVAVNGFGDVGSAASVAAEATTKVGTSFGLTALKIGAVVVVIAAVIAAIIDLWKTNEEFRENVIAIWNAIKDTLSMVWEAVKPVFEALKDAFVQIVKSLEPLIATIVEILTPIIQIVLDLIADLIEILAPVLIPIINSIADILSIVISIIGTLLEFLNPILKLIIEIIKVALEPLVGAIKVVVEIIQFVLEVLEAILNFLSNQFVAGLKAFKEFWDSTWSGVFEAFNKFVTPIVEAVQWVVEKIVGFFEWLKYKLIGDPIVIDLVNGVYDVFKSGFELVLSVVETVVKAILGFFEWLFDSALNVIGNFVQTFVHAFDGIVETVSNLFNNIFETIVSFGSALIEAAKNIGQGFSEGILGAASNVKEFFTNFMSSAIDVITGFVSKFAEAGKSIMSAVWDGIKSVWENISKWFSEKIQSLVDFVSKIFDPIKNLFSGIGNFFSGVTSKISGSHENGLAYVPYDGYIAQLHKGERVLTKQENQNYNNGKSSGIGTINFYSNEKIDEYQASRLLQRTIKEIDLGMI